jgi:hypothetical protein
MIRYKSLAWRTRSCANGCVIWRVSGVGSDIGACSSRCAVRVSRRGSTAFIVSTAKRDLRCVEHKIDWHYIAPGKPMHKWLREEL